ncbi:MAG TPA: hypothetical protein VHV83_02575 [Armatimonadota bacterium]|nr:hypothetical protein [Armatimonadota bacterium]
MTPDGTVYPATMSPAVKMASSSFYLGLLGLIAVIIGFVVKAIPLIGPILLFGGMALGVIAVVLGVIGLISINRASAIAGLIFGVLTILAFVIFGGIALLSAGLKL